MMEFHTFKKPKKLKNGKTVHRWYYYYIDGSGKQIQKSCGVNVRNRQAAENYIRTLPAPRVTGEVTTAAAAPRFGNPHAVPARIRNNPDMLVSEIAEKMFIPGSPHVQRRQQLKKSVDMEVLKGMRIFMNYIIEVWGDRMLRSLELDEIMNYLFAVERSGSWKTHYISALNEIYMEGQFLGCKVYKPNFPSIGKNCKKADIFTEAELERLFKIENFPSETLFLFFLTSLSGGLRLGEARGMRPRQIIFDKQAVIVDGYLRDNGDRTVYNKKGSPEHPKLRVVPYPEVTLAMLRRYIEQEKRQPGDYLFQYEGGPVAKCYAEGNFIRAMIKAGIALDKDTLKALGYWRHGHVQKKTKLIPDGRRLVPHSLRYNFVTKMSLEVPAQYLMRMTGHESTEMVDYYNRENLEMALASIPNAAAATRTLLPKTITL
jgi:integrase